MQIQIVSDGLFNEALQTVPLCPNYSLIQFTASGIDVIPNSEIRVGYNQIAGEFRPESLVYFTKESPDNIPNLIRGGKIENIKLEASTDYFPGEEIFTKFRDLLLPTFTDNGYDITKGELWLKVKYNERYHSKSVLARLDLHKTHELSNLELKISPWMDMEGKETLTAWFKQLFERYSHR